MIVLIVQVVCLLILVVSLAGWARAWPYPSPFIREWLAPQQRWPEQHVRDMIASGHFHPRYLSFFNRDPVRNIDDGQDLLAPADGLLLSADVRDGIRYIVIALSFWDVHVQRSVISGRVLAVETLGDAYRDGEGRDFAFLAAKHCPVQKRIVLDTDQGTIAIRLITSVAARRIEVWPAIGDPVVRGERIGRILLGSTVVLEVPAERECLLATGQRVVAGHTRLVAHVASGTMRHTA